jgi:hypothetical protein
MAEYLTVTRPDGKEVTVSRKMFDRTYKALGYVEGDTVTTTDTYEAQGETVTTKPKSKRKNTLQPKQEANGPTEETDGQ